MAIHQVTIEVGNNRSITIETGKLALLADGAVTVRQGDTIVLVAACGADPRPGLDFFPLQVDYREKFSAAGMIPGGYFKREARPSEKEILTSRMMDRPVRPLFPKGYKNDVQIQSLLLSADGENEPDVLAMLGISAALTLSSLPFEGPLGAVRVGLVDGEFVANPTQEEMTRSELDLVYAGLADKTIMIEGAADEVSEEQLRDALSFANEIVKKQIDQQNQLASVAGKEKREAKVNLIPQEVTDAVKECCGEKVKACCELGSKEERSNALAELRSEAADAIDEKLEGDPEQYASDIKKAFEELLESAIREELLENGKRVGGRGTDELREISAEVGLIPRAHGSGLFARGETQALVLVTLGSLKQSQTQDAITGGETEKKFYLHYNFPNFSVGETGRIMGPGRREIGHGALAERSVARAMPEDFPYAVRCVSEVMGSNGSTSMASICGATLALMDAGVPIKRPVAGISCGLIMEGDRKVLLTDILGSEDHYGDMDFKIAGTTDGITGFQLDLKIAGISIDLMYEAMLRNKTARLDILKTMTECIASPRDEINRFAPRIETIKIKPDKIGALIGPGGKTIRGITDEYGVEIDIEDDGSVRIYANDGDKMAKALEAVGAIVAEVEIGKIYHGLVKSVKDFGAFVEVLPGQEGLVHISELADYRVGKVEDICSNGDKVSVKVIDIDEKGRIRLSRRAALSEMEE